MLTIIYNSETRSFAMTSGQVIKVIDALKNNFPEITFYRVPKYQNACYINDKSTQLIRELANESESNAVELSNTFGLTIDQVKTISGHVVLYGDDFSAPEILAHELGHYQVYKDGKLSKICQKYLHPNKLLTKATSIGIGLCVLIDPKKAWIPGTLNLITKIPQLYYEYKASKNGLKLLKGVQGNNFTKEDLKSMKSSLKGAWGTYLFSALTLPVAATVMSGVAGSEMPVSSGTEFLAMNASGLAAASVTSGLQKASGKKMMKHAGRRKINILGIKGGSLVKSLSDKIKSIRGKKKVNKVNRVIRNFKTSNGFERVYSIGTPILESNRDNKPYRVISELSNGDKGHVKVSVNHIQAKSPYEAQRKLMMKNRTRHGMTKHTNVRAFEAGRQDNSASHYYDSLQNKVQRLK